MSPSAKRLKISIACQNCRSKKIKCDGTRPACSNCQKKIVFSERCMYHRPSESIPDTSSNHQRDNHTVIYDPDKRECTTGDALPAQQYNDDQVPCAFAAEVKAAIDARLGLPSGGKPHQVPMLDAPLFPSLDSPQTIDHKASQQTANVLPLRKHADGLMDIYWRCIQSIEPFLDQERFSKSYVDLFAGTLDDGVDERILMSTMNTTFALSTQLQEGIREQRDDASKIYFQRAWSLLRPESILWEPGSVELVECLLLMSRYLQCTDNSHQTWMIIGSAVRIAQSLGLHLCEATSLNSRNNDMRRVQLWQCCISMDRRISWMLGRISMSAVSLNQFPVGHNSFHNDGSEKVPYFRYFAMMSELYEIANYLILVQISARNNFTEKLGLSRLYQHQEYCSVAVQLDNCLNNWENDLPQSVKLDNLQQDADDVQYRQAIMLRLRILHTRIHLYRPMLARVCLAQTTSSPLTKGLKGRVFHECAMLCISNAQAMVDLIYENHRTLLPLNISVIPWWFRIFYLNVASTILIAASLNTDIFTPAVSQSWSKAMIALKAHEHLSPFVTQCVVMFEGLKEKLAATHRPTHGADQSEVESPNTYFQDAFHDMGYEPDNFLFGKEDLSWLGNFEVTQ